MGRKESIKQNNESHKEREEYMEPSGFQELEIESHREAQALCAENLHMEISNENCSEEELKTDRDNFESTDEIDEENKREKYEIKILEIEYENPKKDKKTIKKQEKIKNKENDKEKQETFATKELANNKKEKNDSLNKISTTEKSLNNEEEGPEKDKKT